MSQALWTANIRILLWLNHLLAAHPALYKTAVFVTDKGADLGVLLMGAWLWFYPPNAWRYPSLADARHDSRGRLLVFGVAAVAAYITARLIAMTVDLDRPFITYLPVRSTPGAFEGLRTFGTFPSDHAALLAALPFAFARWDARLGLVWGALGVLLMAVRVAVAFHYPHDMLAGALIGAAFAEASMRLYDHRGVFYRLASRVAGGFSHPRTALLLYGLLLLVGIEFANKFHNVLNLLLHIRMRLI